MADHATTTQQRYPWRAVVRTVLAGVIAAGVVLPIAVTILNEQLATYLPDSAKAWLVGAAAASVAVAGAVTRIIAIPQVDAWLKRLGLSSSPTPAPAIHTLPVDSED
jgi:hypothetical protein